MGENEAWRFITNSIITNSTNSIIIIIIIIIIMMVYLSVYVLVGPDPE